MAYASLLRRQQRHSHIPELICGFNSKDSFCVLCVWCVLAVVVVVCLIVCDRLDVRQTHGQRTVVRVRLQRRRRRQNSVVHRHTTRSVSVSPGLRPAHLHSLCNPATVRYGRLVIGPGNFFYDEERFEAENASKSI